MCYEIMIRLGDAEACVDWTSRTNLNCVNDLLVANLNLLHYLFTITKLFASGKGDRIMSVC